jgi:hypothetical protein
MSKFLQDNLGVLTEGGRIDCYSRSSFNLIFVLARLGVLNGCPSLRSFTYAWNVHKI